MTGPHALCGQQRLLRVLAQPTRLAIAPPHALMRSRRLKLPLACMEEWQLTAL